VATCFVQSLLRSSVFALVSIRVLSCIVFERQGDKQMRMPLQDDVNAKELITDVGGNTEGPEAVLTVDEYLMPQKWIDEEKKTDEV